MARDYPLEKVRNPRTEAKLSAGHALESVNKKYE